MSHPKKDRDTKNKNMSRSQSLTGNLIVQDPDFNISDSGKEITGTNDKDFTVRNSALERKYVKPIHRDLRSELYPLMPAKSLKKFRDASYTE